MNNLRKTLIVGVAGILALSLGTGAMAQGDERSDVEKKQQQNADRRAEVSAALEGTNSELASAYLELDDVRNVKLPAAQKALAAAEDEYVGVKNEYDKISDRLDSSKKQKKVVTDELKKAENNEKSSKDNLNDLARSAMKGQALEGSEIAIIIGSKDLNELGEATRYSLVASRTQEEILSEAQEAQGIGKNRESRLTQINDEIGKLKDAQEAKLKESEKTKKAAEDAKSEVDAVQSDLDGKTATLETLKAKYQNEENTLKSEADKLSAQLADIAAKEAAAQSQGGGNGGGPAVANPGGWAYPVNPHPITSPFSQRINPVTGSGEFHSGTDFGPGCGTPIYASKAGTVLSSGWRGGYGNSVVVTHGGGWSSTYNHMVSTAISPGASVPQGGLLGYVGTTGQSTGCHLHFEILSGGTFLNPMNYLP